MNILIMPLTTLQLMSYKIETHNYNKLKHVHKQAQFYSTLQVQYGCQTMSVYSNYHHACRQIAHLIIIIILEALLFTSIFTRYENTLKMTL